MPTKTHLIRLLSLLAVCALALGAAACGGSDDDDGGGSGGGDAADAGGEGSADDGADAGDDSGSSDGDAASDEDGSPKARARAAVERLYAAMREMDAEGVCDQLNQDAQDQIAQGGLAGDETGSCVEGFESFFAQAREAGGMKAPFEAEVRKVVIDGDRATVTVNFGPQRNGDIPLVDVDGEWKLEAVGAAPSN